MRVSYPLSGLDFCCRCKGSAQSCINSWSVSGWQFKCLSSCINEMHSSTKYRWLCIQEHDGIQKQILNPCHRQTQRLLEAVDEFSFIRFGSHEFPFSIPRVIINCPVNDFHHSCFSIAFFVLDPAYTGIQVTSISLATVGKACVTLVVKTYNTIVPLKIPVEKTKTFPLQYHNISLFALL